MKIIKKELVMKAVPALLVIFPALGDLIASQEVVTAKNLLGLESNTAVFLAIGQVLGGGMLFYRRLAAIGALFCAIVLSGAIPAHFLDLGFEDEMGLLFAVSFIGFLISSWLALTLRKELPFLGRFF